jgi:hypothetical protein
MGRTICGQSPRTEEVSVSSIDRKVDVEICFQPRSNVAFGSKHYTLRDSVLHSVSAVSIGPLAKTPYLLSSPGAADHTIAASAAGAAPAA